jgi:hypothetical protein
MRRIGSLGRNRPEEGDIGILQLACSARSIRLADEGRARVGSGHSEQGDMHAEPNDMP